MIRIEVRDFFRTIVASNSKRSRDDKTKFTEAEKNWNLEKLYEDLRAAKQRCGSAKRKILTDTEKCHLSGLLCGYSPEAIANERGVGFGTVNDALSKTLYCYIKELLDYKKEIRHWGDVPDFLEQAGYKIQVSEQFQPSHPLPDKKENILETSHNIEVNSLREWRFKSVDQLWSKDIGECIGGIRKLERIAKDYPTEHWAIMEELADFIRIRTRRKEEDEERSPELPEDIQTALTVIGQRNPEKDPANKTLDLSNTDIENALLIEAKLDGAFLIKANLQEANLSEATLQGAFLNEAKLRKAIFLKANLQGANLSEAILQGAFLTRSCLQNANLSGANLQQADLTEANLQNANLNGANLQQADLSGARLKGAYFGKANLNRAYLIGADLDGVDLSGASLQGAYLYEADLTQAKNLELKEIELAHRDIHTLLPESIAQLAYWKQFS